MKKLYNDIPFSNKKKEESLVDLTTQVSNLNSSLAQKAAKADLDTTIANVGSITGSAKYQKKQQQVINKSFYDDFTRYPMGINFDGQNGYRVLQGTATIKSNGLEIANGASGSNYRYGVIVPQRFEEGKLKILFSSGAKGFLIRFLADYPSPNSAFAIWNNNVSSNLEFGTITAGVIANAATTPLITDSDFYVELTVPTRYQGQVMELRTWRVSEAYPTTATLTYALPSGYLKTSGNYITFGGSNPSVTYTIKNIMISDGLEYANPITKQSGLIGRWFTRIHEGKTYACTINQGAEIWMKVKYTTSVVANFKDISGTDRTPIIAVSVDGGAYTRYPIADTVTIASGLTQTDEHTIRIVAAGIAEHDFTWNKGQGLMFGGVTLSHPDSVSLPYYPKGRRILWIGDSITAGINVLGTGATPSVNAGELAYPHIASDILGAVPIQVGFGSTGVLKPFGNGEVPNAQAYVKNKMNARPSEDNPDIIVINEGTNDNGTYSSTDFIAGYGSLVDLLVSMYGNVPIIVMTPFNYAYHDPTLAFASTKENCYGIDTVPWGVTTTDGAHPNQAGHSKAGTKMAEFILSVLGKSFFYN